MGTSRKNNLFIYSFNRHLLTAQCEQDPVFTNWFPGPRLSQAGTTVIGEDYQFAELKQHQRKKPCPHWPNSGII